MIFIKIQEIIKDIDVNKIMYVIAINEISGNENTICKFSYAGGISGYSFGRSQFDIKHNSKAREFLKEKCKIENIEFYSCWEGEWNLPTKSNIEINVNNLNLENYFGPKQLEFITFKK